MTNFTHEITTESNQIAKDNKRIQSHNFENYSPAPSTIVVHHSKDRQPPRTYRHWHARCGTLIANMLMAAGMITQNVFQNNDYL